MILGISAAVGCRGSGWGQSRTTAWAIDPPSFTSYSDWVKSSQWIAARSKRRLTVELIAVRAQHLGSAFNIQARRAQHCSQEKMEVSSSPSVSDDGGRHVRFAESTGQI